MTCVGLTQTAAPSRAPAPSARAMGMGVPGGVANSNGRGAKQQGRSQRLGEQPAGIHGERRGQRQNARGHQGNFRRDSEPEKNAQRQRRGQRGEKSALAGQKEIADDDTHAGRHARQMLRDKLPGDVPGQHGQRLPRRIGRLRGGRSGQTCHKTILLRRPEGCPRLPCLARLST